MNSKTWASVAIAGIALAGAAAMAICHVDKDVIVLILGISATPVITGLLSAQQGETKGVVMSLQQQTNGNWSKVLDLIDRQGQMLAQTVPAPAPAVASNGTLPATGKSAPEANTPPATSPDLIPAGPASP